MVTIDQVKQLREETGVSLMEVKKALEEKGIKIESSGLDYVAKEEVVISEKEKEQTEKLFDALDDNDAINNIYSNIKN